MVVGLRAIKLSSGPFQPLLEDYINKRIPSDKRTTVLSIKNMVNSLLFMTLSPLIGYFVDVFSLTATLLWMGAVLAVVSLVFFFLWNQERGELGRLSTLQVPPYTE